MAFGKLPLYDIYFINNIWSLIYPLIFFILILYFLYSFFIGAILLSYREVVKTSGYPEYENQPSFSIQDGAKWFFSWMPNYFIKMLEDLKE
jgi:hypothetical protein